MRNTLSACVVMIFAATIAWAEPDRVISVTGHGVVDRAPDMASIEIGVSFQTDTATEALALTSDAMAEVISSLTASGIAERDLQTQGISLQQVWSRPTDGSDQREVTGYSASNMLTVRVRDLDRLGAMLDQVAQEGANTFRGLRFGLQEPAAAEAEARAAAVKDAMAKAAQLADAAGVTLGAVQSISDSQPVSRPVMMEMASARASADVPVATGEVVITAQVDMVFAIGE